MSTCSFCKNELPFGTGTMLVKNDGKILFFCTRKCEKNMLALNRKSRDMKWSKDFEKNRTKK